MTILIIAERQKKNFRKDGIHMDEKLKELEYGLLEEDLDFLEFLDMQACERLQAEIEIERVMREIRRYE